MDWIRISEKLPIRNGHYLVTQVRSVSDKDMMEDLGHGDMCVKIRRWQDGKFVKPKFYPEFLNDIIDDQIIAWMPLPEPYKGR